MDTFDTWPEPRHNRLAQYFAELEEASSEYWGMHGLPSALVDEIDDLPGEPRDLFGTDEGGDR
jgi:hypothetical protein